jgi:hypothetical protein
MNSLVQKKQRLLIGLETLNVLNGQPCPACGKTFELGDMAVLAVGTWGDIPKYIHESEAARDPVSGHYVERRSLNTA